MYLFYNYTVKLFKIYLDNSVSASSLHFLFSFAQHNLLPNNNNDPMLCLYQGLILDEVLCFVRMALVELDFHNLKSQPNVVLGPFGQTPFLSSVLLQGTTKRVFSMRKASFSIKNKILPVVGLVFLAD